ncbi:MAG: hypothetical protein ACUVYA_17500, partial [Planctomycetota bacterium]
MRTAFRSGSGPRLFALASSVLLACAASGCVKAAERPGGAAAEAKSAAPPAAPPRCEGRRARDRLAPRPK